MRQYISRRGVISGLAATAVLLVASCSSGNRPVPQPSIAQTLSTDIMQTLPEFETSRETNLLKGTWAYTPGVAVATNGSLAVSRTGEALLTFADNTNPGPANQSYLPNPPVNMFGTHLELSQSGNIGLTARLSDAKGAATVSFLSAPPVRYDERIVRLPGVDVTIDGTAATITVYSQPGSPPMVRHLELEAVSTAAYITVAQEKDSLIVDVNGVKTVIQANILDKQVWFGLDTADSYQLQAFEAYPIKGNQLTSVDMSQSTFGDARRQASGLYGIAARSRHGDKLIGTAVDLTALMSDPNYTKFIIENFNEIETEMLAKFQALQPEEGKYQFAELDALVAFASAHSLSVHGHALVFGEAYPAWLQQKLSQSTKAEATELMQSYITTVVSRYDGKHGHGTISHWDVVNEPFSNENYGQLADYNLWHKAIGDDYIKLAFEAARKANPEGIFGINENAMETDPDRRDAMLALVTKINNSQKLIDYVGYQAHFDENTLSDTNAMDDFLSGGLAQQFKNYKDIGVGVRISEATVAVYNDDQNLKARVYWQLMHDCMQASNCTGFNFWGATNSTDRYFYNTGDILNQDPGNDAPTSQRGPGLVLVGATWFALQAAAANKAL